MNEPTKDALPDVWIVRYAHGKISGTTHDGNEGDRYVPASRLTELQERLERATELLREWSGDTPTVFLCLEARTEAFLTAHQEPKP